MSEKILKNLSSVLTLEQRSTEVSYYAQALKKARLKAGLTLKEVSDGICSISYLSKIENGEVEAIESKYVKQLCDSVDLDYDLLCEYKDDINLNNLSYYLLTHDVRNIENYYDNIVKEFFSCKAELVKCAYYFMKNDFKSMRQSFHQIEALGEAMTVDESFMFIIMQIMCACEQLKVKDVEELVYQLKNYVCKEKYMSWLLDFTLLKASYDLENNFLFEYYYQRIRQIDDLCFPKEVVNLASMMNHTIDVKTNKETVLPFNFLESIDRLKIYSEDIAYYKLIILFNLGNYTEIIDFIQLNKEKISKTEKFRALECYSYFMLEQYDKLNEIDEKRIFKKNNYHNIFISFLVGLSKAKGKELSKEERFDLYDEYIECERYYNHVLYNTFIRNSYIEVLKEIGSYKKTTNYLLSLNI